jgi:hypothetical protein
VDRRGFLGRCGALVAGGAATLAGGMPPPASAKPMTPTATGWVWTRCPDTGVLAHHTRSSRARRRHPSRHRGAGAGARPAAGCHPPAFRRRVAAGPQ